MHHHKGLRVTGGKNGVRRLRQAHHFLRKTVKTVHAAGFPHHQSLLIGEPCVGKRLAVSAITFTVKIKFFPAIGQGNAPVPSAYQVLHRIVGGLETVYGYSIKHIDIPLLKTVHQYQRESLDPQSADVIGLPNVGTHNEAVDPACFHLFYVCFFHCRILIGVAQHHRETVTARHILHAPGDLRKNQVLY